MRWLAQFLVLPNFAGSQHHRYGQKRPVRPRPTMEESPQDRQKQEITALQSIYDQDFLESLPPKVWKVRGYLVYLIYYQSSQTSKFLGSRSITRIYHQCDPPTASQNNTLSSQCQVRIYFASHIVHSKSDQTQISKDIP